MPVTPDLTPSQLAAVDHFEGPLLVLAGPGSGKTRVITRRIARLIERGVDPRQILAITFTNKAAKEMGTRVADLLPGNRVWISTFHRFCARVLRERATAVGLQPNFTIFDAADQSQLVRQILHDLDFDLTAYPPSKIAHRISRAKSQLEDSACYTLSTDSGRGGSMEAVVSRVYAEYQKRLLDANGVDFDDLLLHVATLLSENPELREGYDSRFRFVLVDEYQDTNLAQYRIVSALSQVYANLCVTGDPDQAIYGWRGARLDNILRFEADYPSAKVVRLEQNFRSTQSILRAADRLIAHNVRRKAKALLTENPEGPPVSLLRFEDGRHEADCIARQIRTWVDQGERSWSDFAIFYRVNALSREIERALARHRIPRQVVAGTAFFDRAEVKDLLAYLRLIYNPADRAAFLRIINTPLRGIGKTTQRKLVTWADASASKLLDAAAHADQCPALSKRASIALRRFAEMMDRLSQLQWGSVAELLGAIIEATRYAEPYRQSSHEAAQQRLANIQELLTAAHQFDAEQAAERDAEPGLEGFLETTSLVDDLDAFGESKGAVSLMTLHAAKGLEFPVVFVVAVEQNLIPHERSLADADDRELEEERRLLFVGMTRAREQLFLTETQVRDFRGRELITIPSCFLPETGLQRTDVSRFDGNDDDAADPGDPEDSQSESRSERQPIRTTAKDREKRPLLTTGAALYEGRNESVAFPIRFSVGMRVRHPQYGPGIVTSLGPAGLRPTVTVRFQEGQAPQTFVLSKCPLQPSESL